MSILIKGNPKEGEYKLIKTADGWILEGKDIAYCGTELDKGHGNIIDESKAVVTETIDGYYEITAPTILEAEE